MEVGSLDGTGHSGYSPRLPDGANQSGQGFKDRSAARKNRSLLGRGQSDSIHPCLGFFFFAPRSVPRQKPQCLPFVPSWRIYGRGAYTLSYDALTSAQQVICVTKTRIPSSNTARHISTWNSQPDSSCLLHMKVVASDTLG